MIHGAMTDSAIRVWGLKRDVGFWRPSQAVAGAETDGNPATVHGSRVGAARAEPQLLRLRQRSRRPDRSGRARSSGARWARTPPSSSAR